MVMPAALPHAIDSSVSGSAKKDKSARKLERKRLRHEERAKQESSDPVKQFTTL